MPPDLGRRGALAYWLQALRLVAPPRGLLHVGAGQTDPASLSALHAVYGHAVKVLAVEADPSRAAALREAFASQPQVQVRHALVAPKAGRMMMKLSSISEESGLCPPDQLRSIWPLLQTVQEEELDAVAIGECWDDSSPTGTQGQVGSAPNWVFVDCFPAIELLHAVPQFLAIADVVVARAIDPSRLPGDRPTAPDQVSLPQLQKVLARQKLSLLGIEEENHPAVVLAVFARDQLQRVSQQGGQSTQAANEQAQTAAQQRIDQLTKARVELMTQLDDLRLRVDQLQKREEALALELRDARQSTALSLRLQSLREADLKDLQDKFRSSAAVQERQHELLTKLGERLRVASAYFHQLSANQSGAPLMDAGSPMIKKHQRVATSQRQAREKKGGKP